MGVLAEGKGAEGARIRKATAANLQVVRATTEQDRDTRAADGKVKVFDRMNRMDRMGGTTLATDRHELE